jgi:hypothetical protein
LDGVAHLDRLRLVKVVIETGADTDPIGIDWHPLHTGGERDSGLPALSSARLVVMLNDEKQSAAWWNPSL